jgi:hypothetical protein
MCIGRISSPEAADFAWPPLDFSKAGRLCGFWTGFTRPKERRAAVA